MVTLYDILNLPQSASTREIQSRCRVLLHTLGHGTGDKSEATKGLILLVIKAQEVLADDARRADYDKGLRVPVQPAQAPAPPALDVSTLGLRVAKNVLEWLESRKR